MVPPLASDPGLENPTITPIPADVIYFRFPTGQFLRSFGSRGIEGLDAVIDLAVFYGRNNFLWIRRSARCPATSTPRSSRATRRSPPHATTSIAAAARKRPQLARRRSTVPAHESTAGGPRHAQSGPRGRSATRDAHQPASSRASGSIRQVPGPPLVASWRLTSRGHESHGVSNYIDVYYQPGLESGLINPRPQPRILQETPTTARWDGDGGIGLVGGDMGDARRHRARAAARRRIRGGRQQPALRHGAAVLPDGGRAAT